MPVAIVTDSTADIPSDIANRQSINSVPLYVRFGGEVFRDRVDITEEQFYERLVHGNVHPNTAQPSPQDFAGVYQRLAPGVNGIVSIHLSSKLSGTYESAKRGREIAKTDCPIEVVDSGLVTMALGEMVIAASEAARFATSVDEVLHAIRDVAPRINQLGMLDTLKYLALGGRIGKLKGLVGSLLNVKPMLSIRDGQLVPAGRARSRGKGLELLRHFVEESSRQGIERLSVVYNTNLEETEEFCAGLDNVYPADKIVRAKLGPALGVHGGPGALFVIVVMRG
jgi:DegV family protein with EDD domain